MPHGAPDPVEWKRQHPGWVSFPATFVPHPRPIPKWRIINGQRWPLDKRGRPWPGTRYGRPTRPFDELPPGMPAPGTRYEPLRKLENPTLFWEGGAMPTVAEVLAIGERWRAERAAAVPPPPTTPPRAYDGDGLGPARDDLDAMRKVDGQLRAFAALARRERTAEAAHAEALDLNGVVSARTAATAPAEVNSTSVEAEGAPDAELDLLTPVQFRRGGGRRTPMPGGGTQNLTAGQHATMLRFNRLLETLRRLEPNNPEAHFLTRPNTVPSEAWIPRLEAEVAQAQGRVRLGQPPWVVGNQLPYDPNRAPDRPDPRAQERLSNALSE